MIGVHDIVDKRFRVGRLKVRFHLRSAKSYMGRFGGGWNWKIGVQWEKTTVIISMLVAELIFTIAKKGM